jgi:hypothetical protein
VIISPALIASFVTGAIASDADLQRALLASRCVNAAIKPLPREGEASIYEANCFGSSHKVIKVICIEGRCIVSHSSHRPDEVPG